MTRWPLIFSFLLMLALSASVTYWIVQWTAPAPRAVAAATKTAATPVPVTAAAGLFGARPDAGSLANVQLRGIVHAGRSSDSVAIIAVEGQPSRALRVGSDIAPGVKVKQIRNKTVLVSEQGAERELGLPVFTAQESQAQVSAAQPSSGAPAMTMPATGSPAVQNPTAAGSSTQGNSSQGTAGPSQGGRAGAGQGAALSDEPARPPAPLPAPSGRAP